MQKPDTTDGTDIFTYIGVVDPGSMYVNVPVPCVMSGDNVAWHGLSFPPIHTKGISTVLVGPPTCSERVPLAGLTCMSLVRFFDKTSRDQTIPK